MMDRRSLLRNLALGAVAAPSVGALRVLPSGAASALQPPLVGAGRYTEANAPTSFTQGTVIARDAGGVLLSNVRHGTQSVQFSAATTFWREVDTTASAIVLGDFLYVQGTPARGTTLAAMRVWANIGWYHGPIAEVASDQIRLNLGRGSRTIFITPLTLLFQRGQPAARYVGQVRTGQFVDALGMFVPGGDMRGTRLWVH